MIFLSLQRYRTLCLYTVKHLLPYPLFALLGCGTGDPGPTGFDAIQRQTQIVFQADPALVAAVRIDSATWQPRFLGLALDDAIEVEGDYALHIRHLGDRPLELRYDLRFFDAESFLVDVFNPFNLPLRLTPGATQVVDTQFFIRADDLRQAETLALMQVTIQLDTLSAGP